MCSDCAHRVLESCVILLWIIASTQLILVVNELHDPVVWGTAVVHVVAGTLVLFTNIKMRLRERR